MKKELELSVVIPAYNESSRIGPTLLDIQKFISETGIRTEVLVVDDGSKDDTAAKVKLITETFPELKLHSYGENRGKGYATKTGMLAAQGKHVLYMDADNSTNIREYHSMAQWLSDDTIVMGSRYLKESDLEKAQGLIRKLISRFGNTLIRLVLGSSFKDTQCGFKVFTKEQAHTIFDRITIERFGFDIEMIVLARKLGYQVKELPVKWIDSPDSRVHPIFGTLNTFWELLKIKAKDLRGEYN